MRTSAKIFKDQYKSHHDAWEEVAVDDNKQMVVDSEVADDNVAVELI